MRNSDTITGYSDFITVIMLLNLKILQSTDKQHYQVILEERLPLFLKSPCQIDCHYQLQQEKGYYLVHMQVSGVLTVLCQRCLGEFTQSYENKTVVALCDSDEIAAQLMSEYECIVAANGKVELDDLILDELHLYAPQKHSDKKNCDPFAMGYMEIQDV